MRFLTKVILAAGAVALVRRVRRARANATEA